MMMSASTPEVCPIAEWKRIFWVVLALHLCSTADVAHGAPRLRASSTEIQLSPVDRPYASHARLFFDEVGGHVGMVWNAPPPEGDIESLIYARWFDAQLEPLTPDFLVDTLPHVIDSADTKPAAAVTPDGDVIVAWTLSGLQNPDEDTDNILARRFRYPSTLVDDEFPVNSTLRFDQDDPRVIASGSGSWTILWQNVEFGPNDQTVRFQHYRENAVFGSEQALRNRAITTSGAAVTSREGIAYLAWRGIDSMDLTGGSVFLARFDAEGTLGHPVTVSEVQANFPSIAELSDGNILVVWRQDTAESMDAGLFARVFDPALDPVTSSQRIWTDDFPQQKRSKQPWVAASSTEPHAVVAWETGDRDNGGEDLLALVLDAKAEPVGDPLMVPSNTARREYQESLVYVGPSRVAVAWHTQISETSGKTKVVGRLLDVGSLTLLCGDATDDGFLLASDALAALQASVGISECPLCRCDTNGSGSVTAKDALAILRLAVGVATSPACPACTS